MTRTRTPTSKATAFKAAKTSARRCTKCPNRPPRSECIHTKAGLEFITKKTSNLQNQLANPQESNRQLDGTSTPNSSPVLPETPSPINWGEIIVAPPQPTGSGTSFLTPETPSDGSSPTPETTSGTTSPKKRIRVSAGHDVHGRVEGAKRGNKVYGVVRSRPLRVPCRNSAEAGKRFHRLLANVITRCESLSHETGCWLYLGAQHASATTEYTHYASTRLRRDAMPQLTDINQQFNTMIAALVSSRRRDAVDLAMQLSQAREERRGALEEAEASRRALQQERSNAAERDATIARLQALLPVVPEPDSSEA